LPGIEAASQPNTRLFEPVLNNVPDSEPDKLSEPFLPLRV